MRSIMAVVCHYRKFRKTENNRIFMISWKKTLSRMFMRLWMSSISENVNFFLPSDQVATDYIEKRRKWRISIIYGKKVTFRTKFIMFGMYKLGFSFGKTQNRWLEIHLRLGHDMFVEYGLEMDLWISSEKW